MEVAPGKNNGNSSEKFKNPSKWKDDFNKEWNELIDNHSTLEQAFNLVFKYYIEERLGYSNSEVRKVRAEYMKEVYEGPEEEFYERIFYSALSLRQTPPEHTANYGWVAAMSGPMINYLVKNPNGDKSMLEDFATRLAELAIRKAEEKGGLSTEDFLVFEPISSKYGILEYKETVILDGIKYKIGGYSGNGMLILKVANDSTNSEEDYSYLVNYNKGAGLTPRQAKDLLTIIKE